MTHADTCTDATACPTCHDDEAVYDCEVCGDVFEPNEGCLCDGHQRCASCLIHCPECTANMRDDMRAEGRD